MATQYLVFILDGQRYALHLAAVEKVVRMVGITPLLKAPGVVLGVVNVQGRLMPVFDLRRRFRLPERAVALTDRLIVAHTARRPVALVADTVEDVIECPEKDLVAAERILRDVEYVDGIIKFEDGLILIHSLDTFLAPHEEKSLAEVL